MKNYTLTSHQYYRKFSACKKHKCNAFTHLDALYAASAPADDKLLTREKASSHPSLKHVLNVDNWL